MICLLFAPVARQAMGATGKETAVGERRLLLTNSNALQFDTLTDGSLTFSHAVASHSFQVGGLATVEPFVLQDDAAISSPVTLTIGGSDSDTVCPAMISGSGGIAKTGCGTLTLCGNNGFTGATLVTQGTLRLGCSLLQCGLGIMPMGDSITYGDHGSDSGYRGPLFNLLNPVAAGFKFIGTLTNFQANRSLPPECWHHEGHSGWTAAKLLKGDFLAPGKGLNPDAVLLQIGVNDLLPNGYNSQLQTNLENLLTQITSNCPNANILLAEIPPSTKRSGVADYNAMVRMVATEYQAASKHIVLVDNNTHFPPNGSADGTHPNDLGYQWLAKSWYRALLGRYAASGPSLALSKSSWVTVAPTARLEGSGVLGGSLLVSGTIAPGIAGIGSLSAKAVTITGKYECNINTDLLLPTPAADVINASGAMNLSGSRLALANLGTNTPPAGTKFIIATYTDGLTGTFTDLPEGATVSERSTSYKINYAEAGSHITLTVVAQHSNSVGVQKHFEP